MPTLTLGDVDGGGAATVVGPPPQWADDSDATYGELRFYVPGNITDYLEAPVMGTPVLGVESAQLFIRCDNTDPSGSLLRATVSSAGGSVSTGLFDVPPALASDGYWTFDELGGGATSVADVFAHGAKMRVTWASGAAGARVLVLKAHILIEGGAPTESYRRIFPRDDALAGGAGRNWPRPRSVQSSRRTSGGYL